VIDLFGKAQIEPGESLALATPPTRMQMVTKRRATAKFPTLSSVAKWDRKRTGNCPNPEFKALDRPKGRAPLI
jgi:hypothetical protein